MSDNNKNQLTINAIADFQKTFSENVIGDHETQLEMGEAEVSYATGLNWGLRITKLLLEDEVNHHVVQAEIARLKIKINQAKLRNEDKAPSEKWYANGMVFGHNC